MNQEAMRAGKVKARREREAEAIRAVIAWRAWHRASERQDDGSWSPLPPDPPRRPNDYEFSVAHRAGVIV